MRDDGVSENGAIAQGVTFVPSWRCALRWHGAMAGLGAVIGPLALWWLKEERDPAVLLAASALGGPGCFLLFFGWFLLKSPKAIEITAQELRLVRRSGLSDRIPWSSIKIAKRISFAPIDEWRFVLDGKTVIVGDDGLSLSQWEAFSKRVERKLKAAGIPVRGPFYPGWP